MSDFDKLSTMCSLILMASLVWQAAADAPLMEDSKAYNSGKYGIKPNQTYHSSNIVSPLLQVNTWEKNRTDDTPYLFLGLWSPLGGHAGPMIFRSDDLTLVYAEPRWSSAHNTRVGSLNGNDYLVFWEGREHEGHASGNCLLYDASYELAYNITTQHVDAQVDLHECQLTANGSVLITVYETIHNYNLSAYGGPEQGRLMDSVLQEIDVRTGDLLWMWRATDHYELADSYQPYKDDDGGGWDFFHMNSIDKTPDGNYLISSRHLHSISYLEGGTGKVLWTLGGKKNKFVDVSDGKAIDFGWQHHARFYEEDLTQLTFFDNHAISGPYNCTANCSRGLHLDLDYDEMTAQLIQENFHPENLLSSAMGSYYRLPNNNVLIGWGVNPSFTEYTLDGGCVLDVQFATWSNEIEGRGHYRAFKMNWKGYPSWNPSIASVWDTITGEPKVFASWNGATELRTWELIGGYSLDEVTIHLAYSARTGFETELPVKRSVRFVRAAALDEDGNLIGMSDTIDLTTNNMMGTT